MLALPLKMYLRWLFNLKYIIAIPEAFFNISGLNAETLNAELENKYGAKTRYRPRLRHQ